MSEYQERRRGTEELHADLQKVLEKTTRIESAIWPSPGQPSAFEHLQERVSSLETAKAWAIGAFAVLSSLFGIHLGGGHGK
jgi:hypothetical protein